MIYIGAFNTLHNEARYDVQIGNIGASYSIQDPADQGFYSPGRRLVFGTEPVVITADRDDLLKRIIISQCTINLVGNENMTDEFFASTNRTIPVIITKEGPTQQEDEIVFFGYVDPLQFDQNYAMHWEDIEITATDPLGALEDLTIDKLPGITAADTINCKDLFDAILDKIDVVIGTNLVNATVWTAFQNTKVNLSQFFGDDEDDRESLYDTLECLLKYFNMYIAMQGEDLIIASTINQTLGSLTVTDVGAKTLDSGTSISVDDVYSQVNLTCDIEPLDDTIIKLSDDDDFHSDYPFMQRYMTEYVCPGEGHTAHNAFTSLVMTGSCDYDASYVVEHFCYLLKNDAWDFGQNGYTNQTFADQRQALYWLADQNNKFRAAFVGFGKGNKIKNATSDNSPVSTISLDKWLVIGCLGLYNNDTTYANSTLAQQIQNAQPICKYANLTSAILSPTDNTITNYLIISGSILLNPLQPQTGYGWSSEQSKLYNTYESLYGSWGWGLSSVYWHHTVPNPDNGDGAYYTQKWDYVPSDFGISSPYINHGVFGYLDNSKMQTIAYDFSKPDDINDTISKIPILACQLQVGDKYCVERLDQGQDGVGVFEWKTQAQCTALGIQPYFTIGIDPKIGDKLVGQTFKIQNNIDYTMGLDTSGTAIPIKSTDNLSGQVHFSILGPYNLIYAEIDHHVHSKFLFWSCSHWNTNVKVMLENIQTIMVKDLKIDIKSDNGVRSQYATTADNDLVYASDMNPAYIEKLEDDNKICTGLTLAECEQFGIKYQVSNSYILNLDNTYFRGFTANEIKPECCLVDYLYKEYSTPAKMITTSLKADTIPYGPLGNQISYDMLNTYITGVYPNNDKFTIMSYTFNVKEQKIETTLRETKTSTNTQI